MSSPAAELDVTVEVGPADPVTADDVLAEFAEVMRDWRLPPFADPASARVTCPFKMLTRAEAKIVAAAIAEFVV